ncbi:MAG: sensor histidine kinase [Promethearchaeota archaeon]|jgi:signal transduction histidine kinase
MQDVEKVYQDAYFRAKCVKGLFVDDISNLFQIISNSIELCESLLKGEANKADIVEYFHMITQQLTHGKNLIRNVRKLSDLEDFDIPLEPVEVLSTLRTVVDFTYISFPKRKIDVKVVSDYENIYAMANELLTDAFENILMNAINYNKNKAAQITIIVSKLNIPDKNYVKIEFKDNGIGIDDDRKETIFQDTHLKRKHSKGMGIGLSLVAKLIRLYDGEIWIENRIKGDYTQGSNFVLLIPLTKEKDVKFDD